MFPKRESPVELLLKLFLDFMELERLEVEDPVRKKVKQNGSIAWLRLVYLYIQIHRRLISEEANESALRLRHQSPDGGKLCRHPATGMRRTKSFLSLVSITQRWVRSGEKVH